MFQHVAGDGFLISANKTADALDEVPIRPAIAETSAVHDAIGQSRPRNGLVVRSERAMHATWCLTPGGSRLRGMQTMFGWSPLVSLPTVLGGA
jgi:hypothetical protein